MICIAKGFEMLFENKKLKECSLNSATTKCKHNLKLNIKVTFHFKNQIHAKFSSRVNVKKEIKNEIIFLSTL